MASLAPSSPSQTSTLDLFCVLGTLTCMGVRVPWLALPSGRRPMHLQDMWYEVLFARSTHVIKVAGQASA